MLDDMRDIAPSQLWMHVRSKQMYYVLAVTDRIKLLGVWFNLPLVVYRPMREARPLYVRTRWAFFKRFAFVMDKVEVS